MWQNYKWILVCLGSLMLLSCAVAQTENFTCVQCNATENCLKNITAIDTTIACSTQKCYTKLNDNNAIDRGCLASTDTCEAPNCVSCTTANCNKNTVCKSCKSEDNAACAQTDASTVGNAICSSADSTCMISVLQNTTERGCVTEDFEKNCTDTKKCKICVGGICNLGIFPTDRRTCFQCTDTETTCANAVTSSSNSSDSSTSLPCLHYVEDDKCYMYGTDETHVTRGCTSDAAEVNKCSTEGDDKCKTCDTSNCNEWGYSMDQSLLCVTCSSANDSQCVWGQLASNATSCEKKILYTQEEKCYTRTNEAGVVTRGCFYDLDEAAQTACTQANNCTTCTNANGCNNVDAQNFTCIRCRSDNYEGCRLNADKIGGEKCTNVVTSESKAKCFTGVWNTNVVIRGCLIDLDERDQFICNDPDNESCKVCSGTNCNIEANGAAYLLISNGLLAAVLLTLWRLK
ncbi:protein psiI [Anastrepha ludens]|uniref:protein psiI n=1 Tax=Anastrepha ludens TaxID=28586 RepID=UPI0023B1E6C3|nr:protein psiI [Anastrepha ludens]